MYFVIRSSQYKIFVNAEYLSMSQIFVMNSLAPVLTIPRIYQAARPFFNDGNTNPPPESPEKQIFSGKKQNFSIQRMK